jgi:hypothetical protein
MNMQKISMTYDGTAGDSVRQLRHLLSCGGRITKSPRCMSLLRNGLPYFFVELTCDNGSQFGIPAYGDEAIELHSEVHKIAVLG